MTYADIYQIVGEAYMAGQQAGMEKVAFPIGLNSRSVNVNTVPTPVGALPPEELLLPEVKDEGRKAVVKSILTNMGVGALSGAGLGGIAGLYLGRDLGDARAPLGWGGALLGSLLGAGGGLVASAWNTPTARLEAMRAKNNELHGLAIS